MTTSDGTPAAPRQGVDRDLPAERLRALLQHANDLVYSVAIDAEAGTWWLEFLGDRIYDLSGCRPGDFQEGGSLGSGGPFGLREPREHPFELIHPDDLHRTLEATRELSAGRGVTREYRVLNRELGTYRWVEDRSEPEKDAAGRVVGIWGIVRDVTERRRREDSLSELAAIVAAWDDAVIGLDRAGTVQSWNPAATAMYGFEAGEVRGTRFFDLVAPERAEALNAAVSTLVSGRLSEDETYHLVRDGRQIPVSMTVSPIPDSKGESRLVAVVVRDVTERKELELQLVQSQKMEAVGRLAGGIAHDFNNILTVVLGQAETLIDELSGTDGDMVENAREIRRAAQRAASLTSRLLAFSRRQFLQPRPLAVHDVVEDLREMLERLLGEDVVVVIRTRSTSIVEADPTQLEQVLMNLAVNAREAMPNGGRLLIETAEVDLDEGYAERHVGGRPGPYVMLAVSDTGVGMSRKTLQKVFDPFFTTKEAGTGLGLSTVYGIVKQSGGYVWAYSEPGEGTTVKVYLPRTAAAPSVRPAWTGEPDAPSRGKGRILLVEDEASVRDMARLILESYGYSVVEAHDGLDACRLLFDEGVGVDLILTDLVMPRMGGVALSERVRQQDPGLPVLYMSGYTDGVVSEHDLTGEDGTDFIQKPFSKAELVRRVQALLDQRG